MAKEKICLKEISALTQQLLRSYFAGDPEVWFSLLCSESIWLGNGEPMLFGGDAIRDHFQHLRGNKSTVLHEEYYPMPISNDAAQVCGHAVLGESSGSFRTNVWFTFTFRMIGGDPKIVHQRHSYEHIRVGDKKRQAAAGFGHHAVCERAAGPLRQAAYFGAQRKADGLSTRQSTPSEFLIQAEVNACHASVLWF